MSDVLSRHEQIALQFTTSLIPNIYQNGIHDNETKKSEDITNIITLYRTILKKVEELKV